MRTKTLNPGFLLRLSIAALGALIIALLVIVGRTGAQQQQLCPEGTRLVWVDDEEFVCVSDSEDVNCDYGRNPDRIWADNPDGHPFERAFCDGIVGPNDPPPHPLDSPETEGLYCDEVPGCWAYGLTQEGHH